MQIIYCRCLKYNVCLSLEACASVWAFNAATVADAELASWSAESFKFVVTNSGQGDER